VRIAGVPGLVDAEPAGRQHRLVIVDDLDRRRQLVGSTQMNTFALLPP